MSTSLVPADPPRSWADRRTPALGGFNPTLLRIEMRRMLRNRRTVVFTLVLPAALYLAFGSNPADRYGDAGEVSAYIMISMAAYGAALATVSGGAMVSTERALGWSRQLRLTPLAPAAYVAVKLCVALVLGLVAVVMVYGVGALTGTPQMDSHLWIATGLLAWAGSLVFAAFGLFMGYLLPSENVMQVLGPLMALLAFIGGLVMPIDEGSTMGHVARLTPMYGLAHLARSPLAGGGVHLAWLLNLLVWLAVFVVGAMWRFRRDTARV
jgi:ABC-2 type transport system permease protein